jgi:hypothetical protein
MDEAAAGFLLKVVAEEFGKNRTPRINLSD